MSKDLHKQLTESMHAIANDMADSIWRDLSEKDQPKIIDAIVAKHLMVQYANNVADEWYEQMLHEATPEYRGGHCGIRCPPPHEFDSCNVPEHKIKSYKFHEDPECNDFIQSLYK